MTDPTPSPKRMFHVVIGSPDPDGCPICRAHAALPTGRRIPDPEVGEILVQELSPTELLRCPCPLCAQARGELAGG